MSVITLNVSMIALYQITPIENYMQLSWDERMELEFQFTKYLMAQIPVETRARWMNLQLTLDTAAPTDPQIFQFIQSNLSGITGKSIIKNLDAGSANKYTDDEEVIAEGEGDVHDPCWEVRYIYVGPDEHRVEFVWIGEIIDPVVPPETARIGAPPVSWVIEVIYKGQTYTGKVQFEISTREPINRAALSSEHRLAMMEYQIRALSNMVKPAGKFHGL